jgi:TIR domain
MAYDVFVSYSHEDRTVANAAVATLEGHGIRCWIAPRDILPGSDWGEAIIDAIKEARAMVLILSSHSNDSEQIKREVERAVHQGLAVLPFRIEDVVPSKTLEFFISTQHWLDAMSPPLEDHLAHLADTITVLLAKKKGVEKNLHIDREEPGPGPMERRSEAMSHEEKPQVITVSLPSRRFFRILLFSLIGLLAVVVLAGGIWWLLSQAKSTGMDFQKLNAQVVGIKFFAVGQTSLPVNERVYRQSFDWSPSPNKYIDWELDLAYPATPKPVTFTIESIWYGPKGNIVNIFFTKHTIKAGWDNSQHSNGIEIKKLSDPGTYRVVLKIDGKELTSGSLEVTHQFTPLAELRKKEWEDFQKLNAKIAPLKFYPSEGDTIPAKKERVYGERFSIPRVKYIYWELDLNYSLTSEKVTFTIESTWYGPKGNVINNVFTTHTIQAGWNSSWHTNGFKSGKWEPGTYRVVLKINHNEVASGSFQMVE